MQRFMSKSLLSKSLVSRGVISRPASILVSKLEASVKELPFRDAVKYLPKNTQWTAQQFNTHVDNHADALLDQGFRPGMSVLNWMPEGNVKHVSLMAAAKLGLQVTVMDPSINTVADVRECLSLSQCRMIVFDPNSEGVDRLELLRMSIPEFYHYDDTAGQWFHSKYYPNLKFFLHCGFDIELGCLSFSQWMINVPDKTELEKVKMTVTDDAPLFRSVSKGENGLVVSEMASQKDVFTKKLWPFADNIIGQQYFEV